MKNQSDRSAFSVVLAAASIAGIAHASDFDWNAAANGNWGDKAKWNNGVAFPNSTLPDNAAEVKKNNVKVTVDGAYGCFSLNFDSNMGELILPAGKELRFNSQHGDSTGLAMTNGALKLNGGRIYGDGNQAKKIQIAAAATVEVTADSMVRGYVVNAGKWDVKSDLFIGRSAVPGDAAKGQFVNNGTVDIAAGKALTVENVVRDDGYFEHKAGTLQGKGKITINHVDGKGKVRATKTTPDVTKVKAGTRLGASRGLSEAWEPGTLTIDADYEQHEGVVLSLPLGGPAGTHGSVGAGFTYSNLTVTGQTMLGGLIEFDLQADFGAAEGEFFDVMTMMSFPTHAPGEPQISLLSAPVFVGELGEPLTFRLLPDVVPVSGGYALRVEVIAAAVPTPGAATLTALGVALCLRRRRC